MTKSPHANSPAPAKAGGAATDAPPTFRKVEASIHAKRTLQPLNELTDKMKPSRSEKPNLRLSIGDPTVDGNLPIPEMVVEALVSTVTSCEFNGYPPTPGYDEARKAVAQYVRRFCSTKERKEHVRWRQVLMTSGVSHGIQLAVSGLANPGDNILIPAPAFPHYQSVCESYGIECRYYPLNPENNWECDLEHAADLCDERTKGFVIINPSNPCGSNFSHTHVGDIVKFCEDHELVLMSDEIYAEMVFTGETFTSVADFDTDVPRLVLGGTAKYQACPGWRVGWSVLIDATHAADEWMVGMERLGQLISGPNSICQEAIARTLLQVPPSQVQEVIAHLEAGAKCYDRLLDREDLGITFDKPTAGMFVMLQVDLSRYKDIADDMEFYEKLLDEENVQLLPGSIFGSPTPRDAILRRTESKDDEDDDDNSEKEEKDITEAEDHSDVKGKTFFLRATISRPPEILDEAIDRIIEFCDRHIKT